MNILKFFAQLLLFLLLPGVIFTLITAKAPILGGFQSFVVLTGSMEPTFPVGSLIYTQRSNSLRVGDVIAFKTPADVTVTHRIVDKVIENNSQMYKTKGDANNVNDTELIPHNKIIGKTFLMIPFVGYLINFLKTPFGFSALIIFPTTVFIVFEIWNLKKEIEKHIEKKVMERWGYPQHNKV